MSHDILILSIVATIFLHVKQREIYFPPFLYFYTVYEKGVKQAIRSKISHHMIKFDWL